MSFLGLADIVRDWWIVFVVLGGIVLIIVFIYFTYVQFGFYVQPMLQNMSNPLQNFNMSMCNCTCP